MGGKFYSPVRWIMLMNKQDVRNRLIEENKTMAVERSRLTDLMTNVQKMQNDIERSTESDRRRLETQIQTLESQRYSRDCRCSLSSS